MKHANSLILILVLITAPLAHGEARKIVCSSMQGKDVIKVTYDIALDLPFDQDIKLEMRVTTADGSSLGTAISNENVYCIDVVTKSECTDGQTENTEFIMFRPTEFRTYQYGKEFYLNVDSSDLGIALGELTIAGEKKDVTCEVTIPAN